MTSRDDILARLRQRLQRTPENARSAEAAIAATLAARTRGPCPTIDTAPAARLARFVERAQASACTVAQVAALAEAPAAVARYLREHQLPPAAVVWPSLAPLDWASAGLDVAARAARDEDCVGITGCFCAIAETGTLMLLGGPETPASVSLLPETHIALVAETRVVASMEDGFALARAERGELPRAVNFISGPSRTGDIEQTIVLGAHGPARVHLILVADTTGLSTF